MSTSPDNNNTTLESGERQRGPGSSRRSTAIAVTRELLSIGMHDTIFGFELQQVSKNKTPQTTKIESTNLLLPTSLIRSKSLTSKIVDKGLKIMEKVDRKEPFLNADLITSSSSCLQSHDPPMNEMECTKILRDTIERPAASVANDILHGLFPSQQQQVTALVSHNDSVLQINQNETSERWLKTLHNKRRRPGENQPTKSGIRMSQPDGCFFYRKIPILIAEHEAIHNLDVSKCREFDALFDAQESRGDSSAGIDYEELREETEGFTVILNAMAQTYSYMRRYNLKHSYVTSGRCWFFFEIPTKNNQQALHYEVFESKDITAALNKNSGNDYQDLKDTAFVKVLCHVLHEAINQHTKEGKASSTKAIKPNIPQDSKDAGSKEKQLSPREARDLRAKTRGRHKK